MREDLVVGELAIAIVLTPLSVVWNWPDWLSAGLLFFVILLLLVAGTFDAEPLYVTGSALALLDAVSNSLCERMKFDGDTCSQVTMSVIEAGTNAIQPAVPRSSSACLTFSGSVMVRVPAVVLAGARITPGEISNVSKSRS